MHVKPEQTLPGRDSYKLITETSEPMKASLKRDLAATLIATAAGVAAWWFGFARVIWPAHPQIAAFIITVVLGIVVKQAWPIEVGQRRS